MVLEDGVWILRHADDHEVQPVPGVFEEGEGPDAEAPGHHLYRGLKGVDAGENVPSQKQCQRVEWMLCLFQNRAGPTLMSLVCQGVCVVLHQSVCQGVRCTLLQSVCQGQGVLYFLIGQEKERKGDQKTISSVR